MTLLIFEKLLLLTGFGCWIWWAFKMSKSTWNDLRDWRAKRRQAEATHKGLSNQPRKGIRWNR